MGGLGSRRETERDPKPAWEPWTDLTRGGRLASPEGRRLVTESGLPIPRDTTGRELRTGV